MTATFPDFKSKIKANVPFEKLRKDAEGRFRQEAEQKRMAVDNFIASNTSSGSLLALKEISEKVPKDIKLDVTLYQYSAIPDGGGKIVLKGETDGYESVAKIIDLLKHAKDFTNVQETSSTGKPGTNNEVIIFSVQANYGVTAPAKG